MNTRVTVQGGYVYLLTVLVVGVLASAVTLSFMLLSTSALHTGVAVQQSAEALAAAQGCAEYAVHQLLTDPFYTGSETQSYGSASCDILQTVGSGNENRTICIDATAGTVTRRLEIIIQQLLPQVRVFAWQEVPIITACPY
jgi:hypothetical protein